MPPVCPLRDRWVALVLASYRLLAIMGAPPNEYSVPPQWVFPIDALRYTPSVATSGYAVGKELYDRARGVEFLFRLGSSLGLLAVPVVLFMSAILIFSCLPILQAFLCDVHRSDLVSPIFHEVLYGRLSQTGALSPSAIVCVLRRRSDRTSLLHAYFWRPRLRNVAESYVMSRGCANPRSPERTCRTYRPRVWQVYSPFEFQKTLDGFRQEVEQQQTAILLTEEALLEALCFDFVTTSPHVILVDIFDAQQASAQVQDYAWSLAHDS